MNSLVSNSVNVVHMKEPSVREHPLFEITWVVDMLLFDLFYAPFETYITLSAYDADETINQGGSGLVIGWPIIFLLVINKRLANGPVWTSRAIWRYCHG